MPNAAAGRYLASPAKLAIGFGIAFSCWAAASLAEEKYLTPAESRILADITFLADDAQDGRGPGTDGLEDSAAYIADQFSKAGLKPVPGAKDYFQSFTITGQAHLGANPEFVLLNRDGPTLKPELGKDYSPLAIGGEAKEGLSGAPLVFAGYGITAKDESLKLDYDDYAGLEVKGKVVLILRGEPQQDRADSPFAGTNATSFSTFRHKARNAADHGVKAVLLVNTKGTTKEPTDKLLDFNATGGNGSGIPFIMVSRSVVDQVLSAAKAPSLEALETKIDEDAKPASQDLPGCEVTASYTIDRDPIAVKNVAACIEGAGPLAGETIVVGAHYDHLGLGGSGSLAFGSRDIHNGADDNASGTALIMELARRLSARKDPLPRRVLFIAFSAEERGLLGSKHYVENPLVPLKDTVAMLNFDMVGRLNKDSELILFGSPSSPGMKELAESVASSLGLKPSIVEGTQMQFNASDHASFYYKDIPVLFAFTGTHPDYHKPSDDTNLINLQGMKTIADFAELIALDLAMRPTRPTFVKLRGGSSGSLARPRSEGAMPYLGTRPAYGASEQPGVKLEGVQEGSPAEKAGLKGGDVIVKFNGKSIVDVEDYMNALTERKPGDSVDIVVKRGSEEVTVKVTLGTRAGQQ